MEEFPIAKQTKSTTDYKQLILDIVHDKLSYLLLGLTVILVTYLVITGFVLNKPKNQENKAAFTSVNKESQTSQTKTYLVKAGDDLWHIGQTEYGSGYNAYDIAKENKISNPNVIDVGQILLIPSISPKEPTVGEITDIKTSQVTITGAQYTTEPGDYLWKIAQDAYGDGYMWTRIADANQLKNPDVIYAGTILVIPR